MQEEIISPQNEEEAEAEQAAEHPEAAEHPVPGVKHEPEPDAENIMPAEDRPGTF